MLFSSVLKEEKQIILRRLIKRIILYFCFKKVAFGF